jgi:MFS family permease
MWRQGPLAGRYGPSAAMVILFLVPYLGLSAALLPLTPIITGQLHMSPQAFALTVGVANAGYAVGTVLAVQLAQLLPQRRLLLVYASGLVIGSVLAAAATGPAMFIAGHVLQGLFTSMLLIAAAPPLFLGFPQAKLRWTAVILNICIFGAVAAGPLVGGAQASFHAWRPLFWIVTGIAAAGLLMSLLTFQDAPAADPSAPRDGVAIGLAATGSLAAFWGASELFTHRFLDPVAVIPLIVGLVLIVTLWVYEYTASRPLLTVRALASTIPVSGIIIAVCAAAASTSAIALTATVLAPHYPPLHVGLLFIPELVAAVITGIAFGAVFDKRLIHYFALTGMVFLVAGVLVLRSTVPPTQTLALVGSGLTGVGIGASVVPALFLAGFSLRGGGVHDRADPAALRRHADRPGDPRDGHRVVDLLRPGGWRSDRRHPALRTRSAEATIARADTLDGWPGPGLVLPAAARCSSRQDRASPCRRVRGRRHRRGKWRPARRVAGRPSGPAPGRRAP